MSLLYFLKTTIYTFRVYLTITFKAMEAKICQRRRREGVIQYLVKTGSGADWINADELSSPRGMKMIEVFMVKKSDKI